MYICLMELIDKYKDKSWNIFLTDQLIWLKIKLLEIQFLEELLTEKKNWFMEERVLKYLYDMKFSIEEIESLIY